MPLKTCSLLLDIALDDRNRPKRINVLILKVPDDPVIKLIALVHKLISLPIGVIFPLLKFHCGLSLLATCHIGVITIIKALVLQNIFDSIDEFDKLQRHICILRNIFIKRYKFNALDQVNRVARRHLRHHITFSYYNNKNVTFNVHYSNYAVCWICSATFIIIKLAFYKNNT